MALFGFCQTTFNIAKITQTLLQKELGVQVVHGFFGVHFIRVF